MKTVNRTDIGRVRLVNEDRSYAASDIHGFACAVVADGMGGHLAGDVASQMTIQYIEEQIQKRLHIHMTYEERAELLRSLIQEANRKIYELACSSDQYIGMGTTVVAVIADQEHVVIAHIGDSRAYAISDQRIKQLTEDHSLVNELLKSGQINEQEAENHPRRNVLVRALGTDPEVEVDIVHHSWRPNDIILLCTDGLSGLVKTDAIVETLYIDASWNEKADRLVNQALDAGGDDNVTVVLLINEPDNESEQTSDEADKSNHEPDGRQETDEGRGEAG
jgi:protein phosphatase